MLGFGAAAWKTLPRDQWIGWKEKQRQDRLHLIVNNASFLILPWVKSHNLASKVLAMAAKRLPDDWQKIYDYRPTLVETFVEKSDWQEHVTRPQTGDISATPKEGVNSTYITTTDFL